MTAPVFRPRTDADGTRGPRPAIDVAAGHAVIAASPTYRVAAETLGVSHTTMRNFVARFGKAPVVKPEEIQRPRIPGECVHCQCKTATSDYTTDTNGQTVRRAGTCRRPPEQARQRENGRGKP